VLDIVYHDNMVRPEWDEDGKLLNNWDPTGPFDDSEYIMVYFRINTPSYFHPGRPYSGMSCFDSAKDRKAFYEEIRGIFEELGWSVFGETNLKREKSRLHVHPREISGTVQKWEVEFIAENLANKGKLFDIKWVDLYKNVYDIDDEKYMKFLEERREMVRELLLSLGRTNKGTGAVHERSLIEWVAKKVMLVRVGISDGLCGTHDITEDFVVGELEKLKQEGFMVVSQKRGMSFVRAKTPEEMA